MNQYKWCKQKMSAAQTLRDLALEAQRADTQSEYNQIMKQLKESALKGHTTFYSTEYTSVSQIVLDMLRSEGFVADFTRSGTCDCDFGCRGGCFTNSLTIKW